MRYFMQAIQNLRQSTGKFLLFFLWGHLFIIGLAHLWTGNNLLIPLITMIILNSMASLSYRIDRTGTSTRHMIAVAMMATDAFLVYQFTGHPWQVDIHFYFFATLAMLTAFACWQTIVTAVAIIALHHIILNFSMPTFLFPGGSDFPRVLFHAAVVILEASVIIFIIQRIRVAFFQSETAIAQAEHSQTHIAELAEKDKERSLQQSTERSQRRAKLIHNFQQDIGSTLNSLKTETHDLSAHAQQKTSA